MEQPSWAQGQSTPYYDSQSQQLGDFGRNTPNSQWNRNPIAPTPDVDFPASPPPAQRSQTVAFAPMSPPHRGSPSGANTPSSIGLGIGGRDNNGYLLPRRGSITRDSFQQDSDDSPPVTPPLANDSSKSTFRQQEYPLTSPGTPGYYQYGPPLPPRDAPGGAGFTGSTWWRMVSSGWPMFGLFLLGFACALGHHIFYSQLDGRPADNQIKMMRFGGLLSYAAKAALLAAVLFAYRQQAWVTVRHDILRLETIDGVFAAVNEPLVLWNWELFKKARVSVSLAILAWLFPLTVILTPATLTVGSIVEVHDDMCPNIRTLNFNPEMDKNWRVATTINGQRGFSLAMSNATVENSAGMTDVEFSDTFFDYYTAPSEPYLLVSDQSILTGKVIPRHNVALDTCGSGWNCSYTISFEAPGYKCKELRRSEPEEKLDEAQLKTEGVPFNVGELLPNGNHSYLGNATLGDYASKQVDIGGTGGWPKDPPPYPKNLGAFKMEPKIYIAYSEATQPGQTPNNRSEEQFYKAYRAVVVSCEHYLVNYTVLFNHTFTEQNTTVLRKDYLHRIIETDYVPKLVYDGTLDNTTAEPMGNYVFPSDLKNYRLVQAYHAIAQNMRPLFDGYMQYHPFAMPMTKLSRTKLINTNTYLPIPNLVEEIPRFYENIIFSLFSEPRFLVVAWAAKPNEMSGAGIGNGTSPGYLYPCQKRRIFNAYVYNRRDFWIGYSFAIGAAVMAVVLGSAAISQNNFHVRDVHASSIVAATRAPCFDSLPWKSSKWGEVPPEILKTKLGYGIVVDAGLNGTPAPQAMAMGSGAGPWPGSPSTMAMMEGRGTTGSGERVYYGFAPREVLERTRAQRAATFGPGKARSRTSAFSFRNWD
ncbi:hypothetical protein N0V88_003237 [Collariella sp. IMI 366227]|nr:hypothetical protein N0V88_003237 [Collariella sp. IMI 366227]